MAFTYDVTTDLGRVRLLIPDVDESNALFSDDEINAFLELEGGHVRLAAAQALDVVASNETMILKAIRVLDLTTNGDRVGEELRARARTLREQHEQSLEDPDGLFDIAEMPYDTFSRREFLFGVR